MAHSAENAHDIPLAELGMHRLSDLRTTTYEHPSFIDAPPTQGDSDLSNSSEALFSMYLDRANAEDKEMVESWKGDAEGMLLFVSLQITSHTSAYDLEIIDWSILCCSRGIARIVCPEYSAGLAGHRSLLSRPNPSGTFYPT
jgi:hypothetical protein